MGIKIEARPAQHAVDPAPPAAPKAPNVEEERKEAPAPPVHNPFRRDDRAATPTYDPNADVTALYRAMHGGLFGWGADAAAIFRALENKSHDDVARLRQCYEKHYGRNLDDDLKSELGGDQLARAHSLMAGSKAEAAAAAIRYAMHGGWGMITDANGIYDALEGLSASERETLSTIYQERYGVDLAADLGTGLRGVQLDRAKQLLQGDRNSADADALNYAMKGGWHLNTDENGIFNTLRGKTRTELEAIEKSYNERYGPLRQHLLAEMSHAECKRAIAMLDSRDTGADAAAIHHAMGWWSTDLAAIKDILAHRNAAQREDIAREYKEQFGVDLATAVQRSTSGNYQEQILRMLTAGPLSPAEQIHYAIDGWGADEAAVKAALAHKSAAEIQAIQKDYKERYHRSLDDDLASELGGRDWFDVKMMLRGRSTSADETLSRAREAHDYERSGVFNAVTRWTLDTSAAIGLTEDHASVLTRNLERAEASYQIAVRDGHIDDEERRAIEELAGFVTEDVESYRQQRSAAGEVASTVATTAVAIAVCVGSGGTATPILPMVFAGVGTRVAAKAAFEGNGYRLQDVATDAAIGAAEGAFIAATAGAGKEVANSMLMRSARGCLARAKVALPVIMDEAATRLVALTAQELLEASMVRGIAYGALEGAVNGALVGAFVGANRAALRDGAWDKGLAHGLEEVGMSAAHGLTSGAPIGAGIGGLISAFRTPALIDQAMLCVERTAENQTWRQLGSYEEMCIATKAVHRRPIIVKLKSASGAPIRAEVWGACGPKELKTIRSALSRLNKLGLDEAIPKEIFLRKLMSPDGNLQGLGGRGRDIVLQRSNVSGSKGRKLIWHEAAHNLDLPRGAPSMNPMAPFGRGACVSRYARTNAVEDFAETFTHVVQNIDDIRADPSRYLWNNGDVGNKSRWILEHVLRESTHWPNGAAKALPPSLFPPRPSP